MWCSFFIIYHPGDFTVLSINFHFYSLSNINSLALFDSAWIFISTTCKISNCISWFIWWCKLLLFLFLFFIINDTNHNISSFWFYDFDEETKCLILRDLSKENKLNPFITFFFGKYVLAESEIFTPVLFTVELEFFLFSFWDIKV